MIIFLELRVVSKAHNNVRIYLRDESCKLSSSFMFARPWYDGTDAAREAGARGSLTLNQKLFPHSNESVNRRKRMPLLQPSGFLNDAS